MFLFGKDLDATTGIALAGGYGFTPRFDAEGNLAFYDGVTIFGGNGEDRLAKGRGLDFSAAGGLDTGVEATGRRTSGAST